jgi:urate oxidase
MELGFNRYGKFNVQLLRVVRDSPRHEIYQYDCQMMLEGESLRSSYESADNSNLVATDTQKNTLFAMAKKYSVDPQESWSASIGKDLLSRHKHIDAIFVRVERQPWERISVNGKEHNHAFKRGTDGIRFTNMRMHRKEGLQLSSGFSGLEV